MLINGSVIIHEQVADGSLVTHRQCFLVAGMWAYYSGKRYKTIDTPRVYYLEDSYGRMYWRWHEHSEPYLNGKYELYNTNLRLYHCTWVYSFKADMSIDYHWQYDMRSMTPFTEAPTPMLYGGVLYPFSNFRS